MKYIIGKKIGMTRGYSESGKVIPATIIESSPLYVTKIQDKRIHVAYFEGKKINKAQSGELKSAKIDKNLKYFRQITLDDKDNFQVGDIISVNTFKSDDMVDISGLSKGKGFAGVIKRHNFHRGPKTHGSDHHRAPGSIGSAYPQRVLKGKKMPGHMGSKNVTIKKIKILDVIPQKNLLIIAGSAPGTKGSLLIVKGIK